MCQSIASALLRTDHVFIIRKMIEKEWEYNNEVYQLLLDFEKAYDSIKIELLHHMEQQRREDGQQQMDTQAHHVGPQRRQKEHGTTTDEMG